MASKQIALEVTAFLDSNEARALPGLRRDELRQLAEHVVDACYEQIGKAPWLLDAEDMRVLLAELLPARLARRDPLAEHVPALLGAMLEHLSATQVVTQAFELRRALDATTAEFCDTVASGRLAHRHAPAKRDPFAHGAPKLGRNDPCSCGSGKKYKKCHGKSD